MITLPNISLLTQPQYPNNEIEVITEQLPADKLVVHYDDAQRHLNNAWVEALAKNFDKRKFGHIDVSLPGDAGFCHIMDGQHRWHAARHALGDNVILPCRVHAIDFDDHKACARMFASLNMDRKKVDELSLFRAHLAAGYDDEVHVNQIVRERDMVIGTGGGIGRVACPRALLEIYRKWPEALGDALDLIKYLYGSDRCSLTSTLIKGAALFTHEHGRDVDWPKLRKWVAESDISDPLNLQTKARSVRVLNSLKSTSAGVCFVLVQTYNRRARYNKLT